MNVETMETKQEQCATHGEFKSRFIFGTRWSKCPKCSAELEAKLAEEQKAEDKKRAEESWRKRIANAGIPERFQTRSLQGFIADTPAKQRALEFANVFADGFEDAERAGRSAVFLGFPGTGKTHLACGIGLRIMHKNGKHVVFTSVLRAIRRVKETWTRDSQESESGAIRALVDPHLLILDEVGIQFGSDTEKLILFDVLNERYEKRRPTILISNLELKEVKAYLGERIFDRLREDGGEVVTFDWESHRGKVAA